MKIEDGGAAFPNSVQPDFQYAEAGMSLRDWLAGQVLAAIIQADGIQFAKRMGEHAQFAYAQADAMLVERKKGGA